MHYKFITCVRKFLHGSEYLYYVGSVANLAYDDIGCPNIEICSNIETSEAVLHVCPVKLFT